MTFFYSKCRKVWQNKTHTFFSETSRHKNSQKLNSFQSTYNTPHLISEKKVWVFIYHTFYSIEKNSKKKYDDTLYSKCRKV